MGSPIGDPLIRPCAIDAHDQMAKEKAFAGIFKDDQKVLGFKWCQLAGGVDDADSGHGKPEGHRRDQPWRRLLCRVEEIILLLVFLSCP
ncbi:hypothetical protein D5S10_22840 [Pseudomonas savastanoi]|nr:hypothetical protein D5S10_22840 [Pseudomonas savastanoi]